MKKTFITLALLLPAATMQAQNVCIQPQEPTQKDLLMMLEDVGYKCLVFDLSPLAGKTYHIDLMLREYVNGQFRQSYSVFDGRTRNDFSDLPEADRQRLLADPKNVEANTAKKLIFNFLPSQPGDRSQQNDTLQYVVIGTEMLKMPRNLKKHGLFMPISGKTVYNYSVSTSCPRTSSPTSSSPSSFTLPPISTRIIIWSAKAAPPSLLTCKPTSSVARPTTTSSERRSKKIFCKSSCPLGTILQRHTSNTKDVEA